MSGSTEWRTPEWYFRERWEVHHFTVDAAASDTNALLKPCGSSWQPGEECFFHGHLKGRYYTVETDGLKAEHYGEGDRVFCNPPYDASIIKWVKLGRELAADLGVLWEFLLPPSSDTRYFHKYIWHDRFCRPRENVELSFGEGRIAFVHPTDPTKQSPRAGYMRVVFHPEAAS